MAVIGLPMILLYGAAARRDRYDVRGQLLLGKEAEELVSPLWHAFVDYHVSRAFFDEVDGILKVAATSSIPPLPTPPLGRIRPIRIAVLIPSSSLSL